ncbi:hypothetical protein RGQ13_07260 [Thalassotalea psychrophila]|uniref:Uncharacterized protein n=1 Tax=Thalassotalea psychrophila TaxID=3065647 RepID=A0ABY9TYA1_9GAMM|nr:hypothetical protein RGQ13_07260 [Colwelliaceae bacterium SQ149]
MNKSITIKNSNLNANIGLNQSWFKIKHVDNEQFFSNDLAEVCAKNQQQKRWILCVDSDESSLQTLADTVDKSKILRVNGQHQPIAFDKIARTLLKGNCSTVILCDHDFSERQLMMLQSCAKQGNTECIVVNKKQNQLH